LCAVVCLSLLLSQAEVTSSFHCHSPLSDPFFPPRHDIATWNRKHSPLTWEQQLQRSSPPSAVFISKANEDALPTVQSPYSSNLPYEIFPIERVLKYLAPPSEIEDDIKMEQPHHYLQTGLSNQLAHARLTQIGPNSLEPPQKTTIWELWLQQFDDTLVKILVLVAFASAAFSASEVWDVVLEKVENTDANFGDISGLTQIVDVLYSNPGLKATILQSIVEPSIIIAILLLNAMVGVWQDLSARSSLEALEKMQPRLATVLRCEVDFNASTARWITDYDATQLVPGDIIRLRVGDAIPADARLVSLTSSTMYLDESSLTGESVSVGKLPGDEGLSDAQRDCGESDDNKSIETNTVPIQDQSSMLFSGCLVTRGSGIALVVRTGPSTQLGKIQSTLAEAQSEGEERKTPLGEQLDEFGSTLSKAIGGICIAVWVASIPRFSDSAFDSWIQGAIYYAKVGVALGVAAIPEGLPAVITLCLSLGTRRMAERNVIVRKLPSVETLGCTSVICTDKTGTLTSNQMTAVLFVSLEAVGGEEIRIVEHEVTGSSYNPIGSVVGIDREEIIRNCNGSIADAVNIMVLCNDARLIGNDDSVEHVEKASGSQGVPREADMAPYTIEGEPTEAALLCLVEKLGPRDNAETDSTPSTIASQNCRHFANRWDRYATLEFDRKRKSMGVLVKEQKGDDRSKLFVKGAPGILLERCTHVKLRDGKIVPISPEVRDQIEATVESIGGRALRIIGLASKDGESLDAELLRENGQYNEILKDSNKFATIETGLTLVGLVAIRDPPRPGVSKAIDSCKLAGIR